VNVRRLTLTCSLCEDEIWCVTSNLAWIDDAKSGLRCVGMCYKFGSQVKIRLDPKAVNCADICDGELSEMLSNVGQRKVKCQF